MGTKDTKAKTENRNTNMADVCLAIVNGFFNMFKFEKVAVVVILYLLIRDAIFVSKLSENSDVSKWLIDTEIINKILGDDNRLIFVLGCIIILLVIVILIIIFWVIPIYKKEIERLAKIRSQLMHEPDEDGNVKVRKHNTSAKR